MLPMPSDPSSMDLARRRVARLQETLGARLIETHVSWVLLTPAEAYKIKKPLRLPFLDFTTLAARRHFCEEELRLNRRLAPSLYLAVVEVREGPGGTSLEGNGNVVDAAVRMRRFPEGALWSDMAAAGTLRPHHIDAMALRLAEFHRDASIAPQGSDFGSTAVHARVVSGLVDAIDAWILKAPPSDTGWPALRAWLKAQLRDLAPVWASRRGDGRVRECHGDLHLANVIQLGDEPTAFDGIEFDDALRWIDVLDDIAFLAMDLLAHGKRTLAFRFLNAWLEQTGDYEGLPALRFYMVCRALVRLQVAAIREGEAGRQPCCVGPAGYLSVAAALSKAADPRLAITHGLPGSGKTFISQGVAEAVGAIRLRSDVERKRCFDLDPLACSRDRVPGGIYQPEATLRTYARLGELARVALSAGWPVVVDAASLRRSERGAFAALAASLAVPFALLDCQAPLAVLRRRIRERSAQGGDASEADESVLEQLLRGREDLDDEERRAAIEIHTDRPVDTTLLARRWQCRKLRS